MGRQSKGRQKIEMKRITDETSLAVAFSKRHSSVFKKASELCTLCGVEIAIIAFSPTKKVFSFGHPYVETIIDRFRGQNPPSSSGTSQLVEHYRNTNIQELNMELTNLLDRLESEKKIGIEIDKMSKMRKENPLWGASIENMGIEALEKLKMEMMELKKNSENEAEKLMADAANQTTILPIYGDSVRRDMDLNFP